MSDDSQVALHYSILRTGSSQGLFLLGASLPADIRGRDRLLIAAAGSSRWRPRGEISEGNATALKLAIVSRSWRQGIDVEYLYAEIALDAPKVEVPLEFGKLLAGVPAFAIESGIVAARDGTTPIFVYNINTGHTVAAHIPTSDGKVNYTADISRASFSSQSSADIRIDFVKTAGSVCGALLPTGRVTDNLGSSKATLIDNGEPLVIVRAEELGGSVHETALELANDVRLKSRSEELRRAAGQLMKLGDVRGRAIPRITLIAAPQRGGVISALTLTPPKYEAAPTVGCLEVITVGAACILPGSTAAGIVSLPNGPIKRLVLEYPSDEFLVEIELEGMASEVNVLRSSLVCSAQMQLKSEILIPTAVLD